MIKPKNPRLYKKNDEPLIVGDEETPPVATFDPSKLQIPLSPEKAESLGLTIQPRNSTLANPVIVPTEQRILPRNPAQVTSDNLQANNLKSLTVPAVAARNPLLASVPSTETANEFRAPFPTFDKRIRAQNPSLYNSPTETPITETPAVVTESKPIVPVNPAKARRDEIRAEITERQNRKFDDKWGILDTLKGGLIGALKGYATTGNLGGAAGGFGFGAIQGTLDPNTDEKWSNENKLNRLYGLDKKQQEFFEQGQKDIETEQEYRTNEARLKQIEAQTGNIKHDNEFQDEQAKFRNKTAVIKEVTKDGFDPDRVSPAQLSRLQSVGLTPQDIGKVNLTHPTLRQIGETTYAYNPLTGDFDQTNLPADLPKKFTTMTVKDINGTEIGTFNVTEKDKADFTSRMSVLGYNVQVDAIKAKAAIKQRNAKLKADWEDAVRKNGDARSKLSGQITEQETISKNLNKTYNEEQEEKSRLTATPSDKIRNSKRLEQIDKNASDLKSKISAAEAEINNLKKQTVTDPPEPSYEAEDVEYPSPSGLIGNSLPNNGSKPTKAEAEQYFKNKYKPTPAQLEEMLRQAGY